MANKIRIAVLSGGWSKERGVSINSGKAVLGALDQGKFEIVSFDPGLHPEQMHCLAANGNGEKAIVGGTN